MIAIIYGGEGMNWIAGIVISIALLIAVMFTLAAFIINDGEKKQRYGVG